MTEDTHSADQVKRGKVSPSLVAAVFLIAILIFLVVDGFMGTRAWATAKEKLKARGEIVDWKELIPPRIPDADNFYSAAIVHSWLPNAQKTQVYRQQSKVVKRSTKKASATEPPPEPEQKPLVEGEVPRFPAGYPMAMPAQLSELKALNPTGPAPSLESLGKWFDFWETGFAELREAGKRPKARLEGDYRFPASAPIQNFVASRSLAQILATRARVHLLQQRPDLAWLDLQSADALFKSLETHPQTIMAAMIHTALAGLYVEVVRDGLNEHLWTPKEMSEIQERLLRLDLLGPVKSALREGERAGICASLDFLATTGRREGYIASVQAFGSGERSTSQEILYSLLPRGSIRRNQVMIAELIQNFVDVLDPATQRFNPVQNREALTAVEKAFRGFSPEKVLASRSLPNFEKAIETTARNQTKIGQAAVACALERYRVTKGTYPQALQELVPDFMVRLPHGLVTGLPYKYQFKSGGTYVLYALGADGKDDNGSPNSDWPWTPPTK